MGLGGSACKHLYGFCISAEGMRIICFEWVDLVTQQSKLTTLQAKTLWIVREEGRNTFEMFGQYHWVETRNIFNVCSS